MRIETVLVVDDSEADQFLTRRILGRHLPGVDVLQACDGREALDIIDALTTQPDVIFLDINMPGMNGHGFIEAYESRLEQSAVVVMLTSSDQAEDRERAMTHACVRHFFLKPLDPAHLAVLARDSPGAVARPAAVVATR